VKLSRENRKGLMEIAEKRKHARFSSNLTGLWRRGAEGIGSL